MSGPEFQTIDVTWYPVSDLGAAKEFYARVLGWPVALEWPNWVEFGDPGSTRLALFVNGTEAPGKPGPCVVFSVRSAHDTADRLRALGVLVDPVTEEPGAIRLGTFYDPDGNRLQFVEGLRHGGP
jgi:predicted enzyme related to lactoylglutathione lyase